MIRLDGNAASSGVVFGKAFVLKHEELCIEKTPITDVEKEEKLFQEAINQSKAELKIIHKQAVEEIGEEEGAIFEAHLLLLEDPELMGMTVAKIQSEKVNAAYAFGEVKETFVTLFENMDDPYMKERAADIKDVSGRVLKHLTGVEVQDLSSLSEEVILIAEDLTPSDTASMDKEKVLGFVTAIGGKTSHTAIMARTLEIPAVVGVQGLLTEVKMGDIIALNGDTGEVMVNPSEGVLGSYKKEKEAYEVAKKALESLKGLESKTLDGRCVELAGNIGTPKDIPALLRNDAEGVGLYRTEFLYMDRTTFPSEDEQFESYKAVLEAMNPKPVVIRTLDIGGDKELSYLQLDKEMNPFLGYRAIRICLERTDIFKTQLRALLRASVHGKLRIMFPMISSLEELLAAKAILDQVKLNLKDEGVAFSDKIEVGMMIEVPSAAIISDVLAKHVDFFSIGTNDLIQYTCAVDRMNEKIHYLYNPFNPGVLRLIKMVIDNGHKEGKWVGMCGESAGDPRLIPLLLGLGLDEFSMSPSSVLTARKIVTSTKYEDLKSEVESIMTLGTAKEIEAKAMTLVK